MRVNCDTGSDHSVAVVAAGICGDEGNAACAINDRLDIITIADAALDVDRQGLIRAVPIGRRRAVCDAAIVYVTDSRAGILIVIRRSRREDQRIVIHARVWI